MNIKRLLSICLILTLVITSVFAGAVFAKPKLNKKKITIRVGQTYKLKLKKKGKKKVKWISKNKKIATVSKKGKVKGKKPGKTKIIAKRGKKKYTCKVTVISNAVPTPTPAPQPTTIAPTPETTTAAPETTESKSAFTYTEDEGGLTFTRYTGTETDVVIPNKIGNKEVTRIDDYAFANCTSLKSITIPKSVNSFGKGIFSGCDALETVQLEEGIKSMPELSGLSALKSFSIPTTVETLPYAGLKGCSSLETLDIHARVDCIPEDFCFEDEKLTNVTLSEYLKKIEDRAFFRCTSLESIYIPPGVRYIGDYSFTGCYNLAFEGLRSSYAEEYAKSHSIPFYLKV